MPAPRNNFDGSFYAFIAISLLFIILINAVALDGYILSSIVWFAALSSVIFIVAGYAFIVKPPSRAKNVLLTGLFGAMAIAAVLAFAASGRMLPSQFISVAKFLSGFGFSFALIALAFFPISLGAYLARSKRHPIVALLLILASASLIWLYYFSGFVYKGFMYDDEMFIMQMSVSEFLHGLNPYATSVSSQLYYNFSKIGISLTTDNNIIGVMDYPALFFLSYLPFYYLGPSMSSLKHTLAYAAGVFILLLMLSVAFSVDKKHLAKPSFAILIFLAIAAQSIASVTTYLMLAIIIFAYAKLDSRYSWLLLGVALSMQEELWLPVLFLLAYSINKNPRKGVYNILGSVAVFFAINAYFIVLNPSAFFNNVFAPISRFLFPSPTAPFGYLLLVSYHMLLSSFFAIFALSTIILLLLFLYVDDKRLAGLFSMVQFMFLSHSLLVYYIFFISFTVFTLFIGDSGRGQGLMTKWLRAHTLALFASVAFLALLAACIVYESHASYMSQFSISSLRQSLTLNGNTNSSTYTAILARRNVSTEYAYVLVAGYSNYSTGLYGLANYSIIKNPHLCQNYTCLVNVNRIQIAGSGNYSLNATLHWPSNSSPVFIARAIVYNGKYFYAAPAAYASQRS
ncbi:MAG: hypothetical protein QXL63_01185 [Candidatus Micrarchaeaceae archaeon]